MNVGPFITHVQASSARLYDVAGPAWRILIFAGLRAGFWDGSDTITTGLPMASAVVDDFGQLVLVTHWH